MDRGPPETRPTLVAAELVLALEKENGLEVLGRGLAGLAGFDNFIVYIFRTGASPLLLHTNLGVPRLQQSMSAYIQGLFQLDPFYQLTLREQAGMFRMRDIMPGAFLRSEYYRFFYKFTGVVDEVRYVMPAEGASIHVFVERETPRGPFSNAEVARLRELEPLVRVFVTRQVAWLQGGVASQPGGRDGFDLRVAIQQMPPGRLTAREIDTVELALKGHSTKSLARALGIDDGTAANHKRNIYAKLGIHSQAQLFDLFLRTLTNDLG